MYLWRWSVDKEDAESNDLVCPEEKKVVRGTKYRPRTPFSARLVSTLHIKRSRNDTRAVFFLCLGPWVSEGGGLMREVREVGQ